MEINALPTIESFVEKWLIGYESLEQKLEFEIEMKADLASLTKQREGWVREIDKARFWSKAKDTGYCWEWGSAKNSDGYGNFKLNGELIIASRLSYQLINGEIPDDTKVLHKCDNPGCINPEHLFTGTQGDNMNDMMRKGRGKTLGKSSRYHGVSFRKDNGKWRSFYTLDGNVTFLGCFKNEIDAAKKRDLVVMKLNLDLPLNFPLDATTR